jgi:hypothetical protein
MDMKVRDPITDNRRVDMLRASGFAQRPACTRAPPAYAACLGVGQIGQARRVPPRLHK